ncbi:MAG TPA: DUF72 domain-containing protein [Candidatus Dormibacteraeota bacterium]|nr:DUF72 domain-containing protein [Candidatus Dormibacteraeota bacterium]
MDAPVLIGTCNWADHKPFYPEELERGRRQRDKLAYYARYFPVVEIDTTFYGIPKPPVVSGWVERTPAGFQFNIKAFRSLTGHEREGGVPRRPTPEEERDFLEALVPLRESGKLRAVHYQFPPWVQNRPDNREWLLAARERHPDDILAIEFRHRSWFDGDAWPHTEELLRELDAVFVGVDAPQIGSATAPPHLAITSERLCIVRFHGRNRNTWYTGGPTSRDRFNYLYRPEELAEWVPAIRAASRAGITVHALLNNNRDNYAVANAFDLGELLGARLPRPPEPVVRTLVERDGSPPDWVEQSEPPPEPPSTEAGAPDEASQGVSQLRLTL